MHFDGTITLGNVLSLVTTIIAVLGIYTRLIERLARLETKVDALWTRRGRSES